MPKAFISITLSILLSIPLMACLRAPKADDTTSEDTPQQSKAQAALAPGQQPEALAQPARYSGPLQFTDVTAAAGIHFKHNSGATGKKYLPETVGAGCAYLDYDNDGYQDILLVNSMDWPGHKSRKSSYPALYHNNHDGTFTDVTKEAGLAIQMYG